ncbi:MAG TPA: hypothetical protein VFL98_02870 [Candidatus Paceibacterota bacterium]|nr:hypothetical protein [Candidatus Paceibacterota bacterium]
MNPDSAHLALICKRARALDAHSQAAVGRFLAECFVVIVPEITDVALLREIHATFCIVQGPALDDEAASPWGRLFSALSKRFAELTLVPRRPSPHR